MSMYDTCPRCGSNLDHGEKCDCEKDNEVKALAESCENNSQKEKG